MKLSVPQPGQFGSFVRPMILQLLFRLSVLCTQVRTASLLKPVSIFLLRQQPVAVGSTIVVNRLLAQVCSTNCGINVRFRQLAYVSSEGTQQNKSAQVRIYRFFTAPLYIQPTLNMCGNRSYKPFCFCFLKCERTKVVSLHRFYDIVVKERENVSLAFAVIVTALRQKIFK